MNDRELLELAARAAGVSGGWGEKIEIAGTGADLTGLWFIDGAECMIWNPLEDDGDALRLAVSLRIDLNFYNGFEEVYAEPATGDYVGIQREHYGQDIGAATRRAIVRAAAEIGRAMQ